MESELEEQLATEGLPLVALIVLVASRDGFYACCRRHTITAAIAALMSLLDNRKDTLKHSTTRGDKYNGNEGNDNFRTPTEIVSQCSRDAKVTTSAFKWCIHDERIQGQLCNSIKNEYNGVANPRLRNGESNGENVSFTYHGTHVDAEKSMILGENQMFRKLGKSPKRRPLSRTAVVYKQKSRDGEVVPERDTKKRPRQTVQAIPYAIEGGLGGRCLSHWPRNSAKSSHFTAEAPTSITIITYKIVYTTLNLFILFRTY